MGALVLCTGLLACGEPGSGNPGPRLRDVSSSLDEGAWAGLLHPVAVDVGADGRVYVGDRGDRTVKVYGASGRPMGRIGGEGRGPGELSGIGEVQVSGAEVAVLDAGQRVILRLAPDGTEIGRVPLTGLEETFAFLGAHLALASSPGWSLPPPRGERTSWPLVRVTDARGRSLWEGGARSPAGSAFAAHILNFVLPAGTSDGRVLWLARLNGTTVSQLTGPERPVRTVDRTLPHAWRRIPDDYAPSPEVLAGDTDAELPFDAVTLDIDTDARGHAYVLTALGPTRDDPGLESVPVAVDRVHRESLGWKRFHVSTPATDLAVSPDGRRVYLLHEPTARLRVHALDR